MKRAVLALLMFVLINPANFSSAQTNKPSSPPNPVKYFNKFEIVWQTAHRVLEEMGLKIDLVDRANGKIVTKPYQFVTGTVTTSELEKIATKPEGSNENWIKGRYTIEVAMEIVQGNETLVMVRTNVQGLKQDVDAKPNWIDWRSNGTIERRVLGKLSMKLFAPNKAEEKKGFWEQSPQTVPNPKEKPRTIVSPERDRP